MSSHKDWQDRTLDRLIRTTLREGVENEDPPPEVWERIVANSGVQGGHTANGRGHIRWELVPVLQVALVLLLLAVYSSQWQEVPATVQPTPKIQVPARAVDVSHSPTTAVVYEPYPSDKSDAHRIVVRTWEPVESDAIDGSTPRESLEMSGLIQ